MAVSSKPVAIAVVLAVGLVAGAFAGRAWLTDAWLSRDAAYAEAVRNIPGAINARTGQLVRVFDANEPAGRLRAGYLAFGCGGQLQRAQWIRRTGVTQVQDDAHLLACAACSGQREVATWVLDTASDIDLRARVAGERGKPRTALSCAARDDDRALAARLLERGAQPSQMHPQHSALAAAADGQHWDMLRLLLAKEPAAAPAATFATLNVLYAQNPYYPAQLLPQWTAAGLPLDAHDDGGRNLFHWAALRGDLKLTQALLARGAAPANRFEPDRQGHRPWQEVLRGAKLRGQAVEGDTLELLRLLLPPDTTVQAALHAG
jgi:hypothetical protein